MSKCHKQLATVLGSRDLPKQVSLPFAGPDQALGSVLDQWTEAALPCKSQRHPLPGCFYPGLC